MSTSNREPIKIIAVAVSSHQLRRDPYGTLEYVFDALPREGGRSIVALPPLWPVFAAINGRSLDRAARALWEHDPVRVAATCFAFGGWSRRRAIPWLVTHPVQQEFLSRVQTAVDTTGHHVFGPTSWMGQSHPQWERWPQSAKVFHDAWGFTPGCAPVRARQQRLAPWMRAQGISAAVGDDVGELHLPDVVDGRTQRPMAIAWEGAGGGCIGDGWVWWPRIERPGVRSVVSGLAHNGSWRVAVVSGLDGPAAIAIRDVRRGFVSLKAVTPPLEPEGGFDGGAVRFASWQGSLLSGV